MRGLAFPSNAVFEREPSHEYGSPFAGGGDIPIDPALGGPAIDPEITGESDVIVTNAKILVDPQFQPPPPFPERYSPSRQYSQELGQYPQGPQGDPFAPQPDYFPVVEPPPPPQKPKKKRRPRREEECGFCSGNDAKNSKGEPEIMVTCEDCGRSGHPSCMELGDVGDVVRSYTWRCVECKICEVCCEKGDDERILFCDFCDRGWHMDCLPSPLEESPPGRWHCPICPQLAPNDIFCGPPTEQIYPETAIASTSQSPGYIGDRTRHTSLSESEETDDEIPETPVPVKVRGRPKSIKKSKASRAPGDHAVSERASYLVRPPKRVRPRVSSPGTIPRIRLRLPARGGKGKEREDDEHRKGIFDDILSVDERDTTKSSVEYSDKQRFERSRLATEAKLAPPPPPPPRPLLSPADEKSEISTPGLSIRPLRSSAVLSLPNPLSTPVSGSPAPSTPGPLAKAGDSPFPPLRIRTIRFGSFDIQTWYDAPFPEEYANIPEGRMWICEFCLKYMKSRFSAARHRMKCKARHPPGDEIYRDGSVSIFEVDGRKNKIYCQNLCLLSKMFLDHKSLFYDVEPFLFYVMTEVDDVGAHFVGYFSKEKRSPKDYNVSCIMTLPVRQRRGWGNLLIDFSYLLSKKEQRLGSPEKPLSGLGALGYNNYWTLAVMRYLDSAPEHPRLEDISAVTSMTIEDICNTLTQQNMISIRETTPPIIRPSPGQSIKFPKGRKNGVARRHLQRTQTKDEENANAPFLAPRHYDIIWGRDKVTRYLEAWEAKGYPKLKPEKLKWSPFLSTRLTKSGIPEMRESGTSNPTSNGHSTPKEVRATDELGSTSSDVLPVYSANVADEDNIFNHSSWSKSLQIEQDRMLAREWADDSYITSRRLRSQSTRSSSVSTTSRVKFSRGEPARQRSGYQKRSESMRTPDDEHDGEDSVAADEALAAKLEREERRSSRLLRSRSDAGSVEARRAVSSTPTPKLSSPRKRRRVDSSPEVDLPDASPNGGTPNPITSQRKSDQLANGSKQEDDTIMKLCLTGDHSHSASGPESMLQVDSVEKIHNKDAVDGIFEDVGTPLTSVTSRQSLPNDELATPVDTNVLSVSEVHEKRSDEMARDVGPTTHGGLNMMNLPNDAEDDPDADGEYEVDAEGELDIELLESVYRKI